MKKRREEQLKRLQQHGGSYSKSGNKREDSAEKEAAAAAAAVPLDPETLAELERERKRKERTLLSEAQDVKAKKALEDALKTEADKKAEEEAKILAAIADPQDDNCIYVAEAAGNVKRINIEVGQTSLRPKHHSH